MKGALVFVPSQMKPFILPPYSPHLNSKEQFWAQVKREVAKRGVEEKHQLKRRAIGALRRSHRLPDFVRLFFRRERVPIHHQLTLLSKRLRTRLLQQG